MDWREHLQNQPTSGLSIKRYCKEYGLSYSKFHYHKKKQSSFIELGQSASVSNQVEVLYPNGVRLRLSHLPDMATLLKLVHV